MKKSVFKRKKGITLVEISITIALVSILMAEVLTFTALVRSQLIFNNTLTAGLRESMMTAELIKSDFRDCDSPESDIKIGEDEDGTGGLEFSDWGEYWQKKAETEFKFEQVLKIEFRSQKYDDSGKIISGDVNDGDPVICDITYLIYSKDGQPQCGEYSFVLMRRTEKLQPEEPSPEPVPDTVPDP